MVKKNNMIIIAIAVILGIFMFQQGGLAPQNVVSTTQQNCENVRQIKINDGNLCVGECIEMTSAIEDCIGRGITGQYAFVYDPNTCDQMSTYSQQEWDCFYGNTCTDSSWTPSTSTVCSGTSFTQTSNCGNTRSATGTKTCGTTCPAMSEITACGPISKTELIQAILSWAGGQ